MKHFLLTGAENTRPTDGVIFLGVINLLTEAYGPFTYDFINFDEDYKSVPATTYDAIVVCGSPWLWDNFQKSDKYRLLYNIFKVYPAAKRLFLGVGTCVDIQAMGTTILESPAEQQGIRALYKDCLITVRDTLSLRKLYKAGVSSHYLPCPAFYCYSESPVVSKDYNVLVYCDPTKTLSRGSWQGDQDRIDGYNDTILHFVAEHQPKVFCAFQNEVAAAAELGLKAEVFKDNVHVLEVMARADKTLSGRIHCSVPALALHKQTSVMPIDSRYMTVTEWGGTTNIDDNIQEIDYNKYRKEYIKLLKDWIKE